MRFLLILTFFLSTSVFAQKQLGRETFMVNVRPSLNGILSDFYQMVAHFPDFPKEIVPVFEELEHLTEAKETLRSTCPRLINLKCKNQITSIRMNLQKLKSLSFLLVSNQKMSASLHINSLAAQRLVSEFDGELEEVKGILDNISLVLAAGLPQKKETYYIIKELDEMNTILSLSVVEYIPFMYKEDFRHFYFNFVHPLQQQISKANNYEFVNRNINSLNFAINLLNMTLTKKKKTPEGMGPYLATIHKRWNSILRYYY
jgi:hypothetical protein